MQVFLKGEGSNLELSTLACVHTAPRGESLSPPSKQALLMHDAT